MAARRFVKSNIDWDKFAKIVPENQKPMLNQFRAKSATYMRNMQEYPEQIPQLDWTMYETQLKSSSSTAVASMSQQYRQQLQSLKIPYPADTLTSLVNEQEKNETVKAKQFVNESEERIKKHHAQIAQYLSIPPLAEMTREEALLYTPEIVPANDELFPYLHQVIDESEK